MLYPNSTKELVGGETPLLSSYKPPEALGEPEFAQGPGQQVTVKGSYLSTVFVRESGGLSASGEPTSSATALGETEIIESSLLSEKDLASLTNTTGGKFIDNLVSSAPAKVAGAANSENFYQDIATSAEEANADVASRPPTQRAQDVANILAKYDEGLTNVQSRGTTTILERPAQQEEQVPVQDTMSKLDQDIAEARAAVATRTAIVRAIARGQTSDYDYILFAAYPPGTKAPTGPQRTSSLSSLLTIQGLGTLGLTLTAQSPLQGLSTLQGQSQSGATVQAQTPIQQTGIRTDILSALRIEQLQSLQSQQEEVLLPFLFEPTRRKALKKRKTRFVPTREKNRVARNIAASFGDFAAALEGSDIFGSTGYFSAPRRKRSR